MEIFKNAENITVAEDATTTINNVVEEKKPILCVGKNEVDGKIIGYLILENNKSTEYDAEYLTTMIKTGKMEVANMNYDNKSGQLEYRI